METQRCWRCQEHKISTEKSCGHGTVLAQEKLEHVAGVRAGEASLPKFFSVVMIPQMPNMEVEDVVFALLGFGLAQSVFPGFAPIPPFWNRKIYSAIHYILQLCNSCFMRLP